MSFMPLFPHAALIRKLVYQNIFELESYADRNSYRSSPDSQNFRVKASLLAEEFGPPWCVTSSLLSFLGPAGGSFLAELPPHGGRRRNLTFERQTLTLARENRVIISFLPAETSLCLVSLRSKATFHRKSITLCTGWTKIFSTSLNFFINFLTNNYLTIKLLLTSYIRVSTT
jgi:hypothetical protein